MANLPPDGLLYDPDITTQEEIDTFRAFYKRTKGYSLPAFEFWLDLRPDVLKRYRANYRREVSSAEEKLRPIPHVLAMLHYYVIVGYGDGVLYELKLAQSEGAARGECLDAMAFAFINSGPMGMDAAGASSLEFMKHWTQDDEALSPSRWPPGWSFDRDAFRSGMDFATPEASRHDLQAVQDWYQSRLGEVPKYVQFLVKHRPNFLKALRNRYESALRDGLPKEMVPYMLLFFNVVRGFSEGIREAVLLGRSFNMTKSQLTDAICWASYYGGMDGITIAEQAAGELLDRM